MLSLHVSHIKSILFLISRLSPVHAIFFLLLAKYSLSDLNIKLKLLKLFPSNYYLKLVKLLATIHRLFVIVLTEL